MSNEMKELSIWKGSLRNTKGSFAFRCWQNFNRAGSYYWLRISYQHHSRIYEGWKRHE